MIHWRWWSLPITVALVIWKVFDPALLAEPVYGSVPVSWFTLTFLAFSWFTAWCLTPAVAAFVNGMARRWFLPAFVLMIFALGVLGFFDLAWNSLIKSWCASCWESNLFGATVAAFGG